MTQKITALYERLLHDDELQGESKCIFRERHQAKTESMESRGCRHHSAERPSLSGSRKLKEEVTEVKTVKRCAETVFTDRAIPPKEQRKEKSKTQDILL